MRRLNPSLLKRQKNLKTLKGHRSVGGIASIYNAFPEAGVDALISFMLSLKLHTDNPINRHFDTGSMDK